MNAGNISKLRLSNWFSDNVIFVLLLILYIILSFGVLRQNWDSYSVLLLLMLCFVLMVFNHLYSLEINRFFYYSIPFLMSGFIIYANALAVSGEYKIIIIVVVASIINDYPASFTFLFQWIPLLVYLSVSAFMNNNNLHIFSAEYFMSFILKNSITYFLVVFSVYLVKKQLYLNKHLESLMKELKENREKLKELGILEERDRIAREIHDTLGYTLTGAIIQLEAAKKYVYIDKDKAFASIERTQDITRQGFSDVKRAIKALRPIAISEKTLKEVIYSMKNRINNCYNFTLETHMDIPDDVEEKIKSNIIPIIQELVTNSIKHSNSNSLDLTLDMKNDQLILFSFDNGSTCSSIVEGYGLTGIRERAELLGGEVKYSIHKIEGFQTLITLPIGK